MFSVLLPPYWSYTVLSDRRKQKEYPAKMEIHDTNSKCMPHVRLFINLSMKAVWKSGNFL